MDIESDCLRRRGAGSSDGWETGGGFSPSEAGRLGVSRDLTGMPLRETGTWVDAAPRSVWFSYRATSKPNPDGP